MIDQMSNQLSMSILTSVENDSFVTDKNREDDTISANTFDNLIATLNAATVDSLTAISINNTNSAKKSSFAPSISSNIGNFATSVSTDGKLSSPSIKQSPHLQNTENQNIHLGNSKIETIKLGKVSSNDLQRISRKIKYTLCKASIADSFMAYTYNIKIHDTFCFVDQGQGINQFITRLETWYELITLGLCLIS